MAEVSKIKKRDGRIVSFDGTKIATAILKALKAAKKEDEKLATELSEEVVRLLNEQFKDKAALTTLHKCVPISEQNAFAKTAALECEV